VSALTILPAWQRSVKGQLLAELHGHQAKSLAAFSLALLWAAPCHSGRLEVAVPGRAKPGSVRRRLERLLANRRLRTDPALRQLARVVLACCATGQLLLLLLDETAKGNALRCLKVSLTDRGRAAVGLLPDSRAARAAAALGLEAARAACPLLAERGTGAAAGGRVPPAGLALAAAGAELDAAAPARWPRIRPGAVRAPTPRRPVSRTPAGKL
jgi:hypothetical protein